MGKGTNINGPFLGTRRLKVNNVFYRRRTTRRGPLFYRYFYGTRNVRVMDCTRVTTGLTLFGVLNTSGCRSFYFVLRLGRRLGLTIQLGTKGRPYDVMVIGGLTTRFRVGLTTRFAGSLTGSYKLRFWVFIVIGSSFVRVSSPWYQWGRWSNYADMRPSMLARCGTGGTWGRCPRWGGARGFVQLLGVQFTTVRCPPPLYHATGDFRQQFRLSTFYTFVNFCNLGQWVCLSNGRGGGQVQLPTYAKYTMSTFVYHFLVYLPIHLLWVQTRYIWPHVRNKGAPS